MLIATHIINKCYSMCMCVCGCPGLHAASLQELRVCLKTQRGYVHAVELHCGKNGTLPNFDQFSVQYSLMFIS